MQKGGDLADEKVDKVERYCEVFSIWEGNGMAKE